MLLRMAVLQLMFCVRIEGGDRRRVAGNPQMIDEGGGRKQSRETSDTGYVTKRRDT